MVTVVSGLRYILIWVLSHHIVSLSSHYRWNHFDQSQGLPLTIRLSPLRWDLLSADTTLSNNSEGVEVFRTANINIPACHQRYLSPGAAIGSNILDSTTETCTL